MFRIFCWAKLTQTMIKIKRNLKNFWLKFLTFSYLNISKPASVFFRKVFEFNKIKESLGLGVIVAAFTANVFPAVLSLFQISFVKVDFGHVLPVEITTEQSLQKPVDSFHLTKGYSFFHPGLDFATDAGSAVLPILPGKVERVERLRFGYGNYVVVNHGSGRKSLYAHFSKIAVKEEQTVEKDTVIGFIGSTGWSTGPHLHLEIMENGQKINPKALFEEYFGKKLASSR